MTSSLPLVGAQAVILGMSAFNNNARSVNGTLRAMGQSAYYLQRTSEHAMRGTEGAFTGAFGAITRTAIIAGSALAALATGAVILGQRYGRELNFISAIGGVTSDKLEELNNKQLELSRASNVSAMSISQASAELVKAGVSIDDVLGKTLEYTNALVVASNKELDAARAAGIMQVSLGAFGASAEEAANAATAAVQKSLLTFTDYSDALRQAGPVAAQFNMSLSDTAAVIGVLGTVLDSGTEVGTGFRMMLQKLKDPTVEDIKLMRQYGISLYDAEGASRDFFDVLFDLEKQFGKTAIEQGKITQAARDHALAMLFDGRTAKTVAVLIDQGTEAFVRMRQAIGDTKVLDLQRIILSDTANVLEVLGNNAAAAGIKFSQGLDPYINTVANSLLNLAKSVDLNVFKGIGDAFGSTLYNVFANLGNILGVVLGVIFDFVGSIGNLIGSLLDAVDAGDILVDKVDDVSNTLSPLVDAIEIVLTVIKILTAIINEVAAAADQFRAVAILLATVIRTVLAVAVAGIAPPVQVAIGAFQWIIAVAQDFGDVIHTVFNSVIVAASALGQTMGRLGQYIGDVWATIVTVTVENINGILGALQSLAFAFPGVAKAFNSWLQHWASGWGGALGVVGRAVTAIANAINGMLGSLAEIPLIGELVGGARAAVAGFIGGVGTFAAGVSDTVTGFVGGITAAFNRIQANVQRVQIPALHDFAATAKASFQKTRAEYDELLKGLNKPIQIPTPTSEPGSYFGDDGAADKAAKDLARATDRAKELVRDFNDDILNETEKTARAIGDLFEKATQDTAEHFDKAAKDINETIEDSMRRLRELEIEADIKRDQEERTKALDDMLDEESRIREEGLEDAEVIHQRELEDVIDKYNKGLEERRRSNDKALAEDARRRDETREDEDIAFQKSLQAREDKLDKELKLERDALDKITDERERALDRQQEQEERALKDLQDIRESELDKQLDLEEKALERSQRQREDILKGQLDTEKQTREDVRDLSEVERKDAEERAKAQAEYTKEIEIGVKRSIAQMRLDEKLAKIQEETTEARRKFEQRKTEAAADLEFEAQQEARLQGLRETFEREDEARKVAAEGRSRTLRERNETEMLALRVEHERQTLEMRTRTEEAITKLQADHDRRRNNLTDELERDTSARRRTRAIQDREFADEQEDAKRKFADRLEKEALDESRRRDDAERKRKRELDLKETEFRKKQEEARDALSKQFDDEERRRKESRIRWEHDARIAQIETTLAEEQKKTQDKLSQDLIDLTQSLDDRIKTIRRSYIDRLQDILKEGGDQLKPIVDGITLNIEEGLNRMREAADETVTALKEALSTSERVASAQANVQAARAQPGGGGGEALPAPLRPGGKPGETVEEVENYLRNTGASQKEIEDFRKGQGLQYGGVVPGPYGKSTWMKVHGGEYFEGLGGTGVAMTAIRMAEAMWRRHTQPSAGTTNNYEYTVNAAYGRTQPEGSIVRDLKALEMLTRG